MSNKRLLSRLGVLLVAALLLAAAVGSAGAVSTTDSTDATNASAVEASDWQDDGSTTISNFNASSSSYSNVSVKVDDANSTDGFELSVSKSGLTHYSADTGSSDYQLVATSADTDGDSSSTGNTDVHSWNISHDSLATIPGEPGENTTINVNVSNFNDDGSLNASNEFNVTLTFGSNHSVIYVTDGAAAFDDVEVTERSPAIYEVFTDEKPDHYELSTTQRTTEDGSVEVYLADDMATNYSDTAGDASAGAYLHSMGVMVDGEFAPVVSEDAADVEFIDTDSATYAVYDADADKLTVHNAPDNESVDLTVANHAPTDFEGVSIFDVGSTVGYTTLLGNWSPLSLGGDEIPLLGATIPVVPLAAGRSQVGA